MSNPKHQVVITGGTGGIGYQSALGIAKTGAYVLITGRNLKRGERAKEQLIIDSNNENIELVIGDLSSIEGIDLLAAAILETVKHVDVLINNAGYLGNDYSKSVDNLEMHFAVNVLGPYRLTNALLPALKNTEKARVLNITGGDKPSSIDPTNLQAEKGFKGLMTYTHSKSIMEALSLHMSKELADKGITVNILFPGRASTVMTRSLTMNGLPGMMKLMLPFFRLFFKEDGGKSAAHAARSTIWGATTQELDGVTGLYFDTNMKEQSLHTTAYNNMIQNAIIELINSITT